MVTDTLTSTEKQKSSLALYRVCGTAGREGMPGAPLLHFQLLVNAATGAITGQAEQTQAVAGPASSITIPNVTGILHHTGLGKVTQVVALKGEAVITVPPPAIGAYLAPFNASFAIDNRWNGVGGWTLGNTKVEDVPVEEGDCPRS